MVLEHFCNYMQSFWTFGLRSRDMGRGVARDGISVLITKKFENIKETSNILIIFYEFVLNRRSLLQAKRVFFVVVDI